MPPPNATSKQDVGAASTFFGALVTMSAANADVPMSVSAANDAAIVVLILLVMTSPAQAVVGPKELASRTRRRTTWKRYCAGGIRSTEHKKSATAACLGESVVCSKESKAMLRRCHTWRYPLTLRRPGSLRRSHPTQRKTGTPKRARSSLIASPRRSGGVRLGGVVHLVFDRMRGVLEADHLGHLQLDVAVDEVVIEHAAGLEELAVLVEIAEGLAQRAAHRRNLLELLRRQVVEVLVHRGARVELVLDAVETGHQHRGEAEIRVGERVGEAHFDPLCLRLRRVRDAARGRTAACRIPEQDGSLEARDETLVGIRRRVGEGVYRLRVLDDAGNVGEARLGQVRILVAREHWLAALS